MTWKARSSFAFCLASLCIGSLVTGCADLSPIEQNQCGNKVTEPLNHEECDGEADCIAPGEAFACRYKCIEDGDGARSCRLPGYRCGLDDVCRAPSGSYELLSEIGGSETVGLSSADFDDDGRIDVLRESGVETFVQYYGDRFETEATERIIRLPNHVPPLLARLDDDTTSDLAFTAEAPQGSGLVVYRTDSDGALRPTLYATIDIPVPSSERMTARGVIGNFVTDDPQEEIIGMVASDALVLMVGVDDTVQAALTIPPAVGLDPAELVGVAVGDLDPSLPCDEVALAEGRATGRPGGGPYDRLWIMRPCDDQGRLDSSPAFSALQLPYPYAFVNLDGAPFDPSTGGYDVLPPAPMYSAVHVEDITGDGLDDILALALPTGNGPQLAGRQFVAVQDATGFTGFLPAEVTITPECPLGPILAFGDFDEDGIPDVVHASGMARIAQVSVDVQKVNIDLQPLACLGSGGWGRAVVADFDANGHLDVVVTRTSDLYQGDAVADLDVWFGDGNGYFTHNVISTSRPVRLLNEGDFDGDSVQDIVYVEADPVPVDVDGALAGDDVMVAFGRSFGGFDTPQALGKIRLARELVAGRYLSADAADDIAIAARPAYRRLAFAPIIGNGARQLVAPHLFLVGVGAAERVTQVAAVVPGAFAAGGEANDFAVVTLDDAGDAPQPNVRLWRVQSSAAEAHIDADEPPISGLTCFHVTGDEEDDVKTLSECVFAAADLDGDALDELLVFESIYTVQDSGLPDVAVDCALHVFEVDQDGAFQPRGKAIALDGGLTFSLRHFAGPLPQPIVRDFDGDGAADVALLANTHELFRGASYVIPALKSYRPGELVIFWNDHTGDLSTARMSRLEASAQQVLGITTIQNDADPHPELVISIEGTYAPGSLPGDGAGEEPVEAVAGAERNDSRLIDFDGRTLPHLEDAPVVSIAGNYTAMRPRSVTAGDFDGDGVDDIVAGNSFGYLILRGVPLEP